jgi:hypothetical protein
MAIIPAVRRHEILKEAVCEQLEREFGHVRIQKALSHIKGKRYLKDGKKMRMEEIPTEENDKSDIQLELENLGRFPDPQI